MAGFDFRHISKVTLDGKSGEVEHHGFDDFEAVQLTGIGDGGRWHYKVYFRQYGHCPGEVHVEQLWFLFDDEIPFNSHGCKIIERSRSFLKLEAK